MALRVYNTLYKDKVDFTPLTEGRVGVYVCGPTVYDSAHIGHARPAVVFDTVTRYLRYLGYQVTYVRNFTDVDDKIIKKAAEISAPASEVSERYIAEYLADTRALKVRDPDVMPQVSRHIAEIVELCRMLEERGYAYAVDGDLYYRVRKFPGYGKLSGREIKELLSGARVEVDERKEDALDFALWKAAKPGEPWWESPWSKGRPGWHIECSAMSRRYLGDVFDIHGGGADLIFPHHENEIAQSEGATGQPFARYWMHNGHVNIHGEKMSKSLKNFIPIREMLERYHPETLRFFLLSRHYRSPIDYNDEALAEARGGLERVYACLAAVERRLAEPVAAGDVEITEEDRATVGGLQERFREAMDDDFNTAAAIGYLFQAVAALNRLLSAPEFGRGPASRALLAGACAAFGDIAAVFGVLEEAPAEFERWHRERAAAGASLSPEEIERLIGQRLAARKAKNFAEADRIRAELLAKGVVLEDAPGGVTTWRAK